MTKKAFDKIAEGLNEPPRNACADRVIDTERAGGTGNAAPKRTSPAARPLTVDEAMAYRQSISWRAFMGRSERAVIALADEVERLRDELLHVRDLFSLQTRDALAAYDARDKAWSEMAQLHEKLRQAHEEIGLCDVEIARLEGLWP